jgi:acylphosphatase
LNDGAVEVVARGEAQVLDELERYLSIGPRMAAVESVENRDIPHDINIANSFDIN